MRTVDRWLQRWRWRMALPWVPRGAHLLDIGCHEGEWFNYLGDRIEKGIGVDPLATARQTTRYDVRPEAFTIPLAFPSETFEAITLLATLEHLQDKEPLSEECYRLLRANGRVIITVPSPQVDKIVAALRWLRIADGMSIEQHHDFRPEQTLPLFLKPGFALAHVGRFQFGLNWLFVFRK